MNTTYFMGATSGHAGYTEMCDTSSESQAGTHLASATDCQDWKQARRNGQMMPSQTVNAIKMWMMGLQAWMHFI